MFSPLLRLFPSKDPILHGFPVYLQSVERRVLVKDADFQRRQLIAFKIPEMTRYQGETSHAGQRIDAAPCTSLPTAPTTPEPRAVAVRASSASKAQAQHEALLFAHLMIQ